jgi:hypothetical protein
LSHSSSPVFVLGFFWDRVSWTICLGWLWAMTLLISAFEVARITGVSYRNLTLPAEFRSLKLYIDLMCLAYVCTGYILLAGIQGFII